jgi:hypothetical protein
MRERPAGTLPVMAVPGLDPGINPAILLLRSPQAYHIPTCRRHEEDGRVNPRVKRPGAWPASHDVE